MQVVIGKTAGFCWGVRRTVDKVMELAEGALHPVVTLGPVIHNPQAVARMSDMSIISFERTNGVIGNSAWMSNRVRAKQRAQVRREPQAL